MSKLDLNRYVAEHPRTLDPRAVPWVTAEEQHAWMRSRTFAQNPIGAPLDMDELAARLKAGVPARQLVAFPGG